MKKGLLFALALGIGTFSFGQNSLKLEQFKVNTAPPEYSIKADLESAYSGVPINKRKSSKGNVTEVTIGYSGNIYTALLEQQTALTINEGLNLINYTHRGKPGDNGASATGDIMHSFSTDGGNTWKTHLLLENSAGKNNRYPGGVIFNPSGNTDPNNAFLVYSGPSHDGGSDANWDHTYFSSANFDSTHINNQYYASNGAMIRNGMVATTDGKIHFSGTKYTRSGTSPNYTYHLDTIYMVNSTFNSANNSFNWNYDTLMDQNFVVKSDGGQAVYAWTVNSAWSNDGVTGYYWTIGRDASNDTRSYQPIVWKTINSGTQWTKMPVYDFSTVTEITSRLSPMSQSTSSRPMFTGSIDGVVDYNGDLHLMCIIKAASNDQNDSLGYSWFQSANEKSRYNPVFDVHTSSNGWDATFLGNTYTIGMQAGDNTFGTGVDEITWDGRIQAGKTLDEKVIFAAWTDSDTVLTGSDYGNTTASKNFRNDTPDLFIVGLDIEGNKQTNPTNFTKGTLSSGSAFFHYLSDYIFFDGSGTYTIPASIINKGTEPTDPVEHKYLKGITFTKADFVTNAGFKASIDNVVSVSQNRPNPFNGNTQIDINLDKASNVSINVINITGQSVYTMNYGKRAQGIFTINLKSNNLSSGVYFYTVTAGNSQVTKKMIVK